MQALLTKTAANGTIIFVPDVADSVGVFDTGDQSFQLVDISAQLSSDLKFAGAAPAATGKSSSRPRLPIMRL